LPHPISLPKRNRRKEVVPVAPLKWKISELETLIFTISLARSPSLSASPWIQVAPFLTKTLVSGG